MSAECPEITLIIPAYNAGERLSECLNSVLRQSFSDWELIIADDGSTDGTGETADGFASKDKRIRVIHKENRGVSAARNACIEAGRGRYLSFIDSDDRLEEGYLEELYKHAVESEADIIQCSFFFEEGGKKIPDPNPVEGVFRGSQEILNAYFKGSQGDIRLSCWSKLFRRAAFADVRFDTKLRVYEDALYVYECCKKAKTVCCFNTPLYNYVQHESSAVHSRLAEIYPDFFAMYKTQKSDVRDNARFRKRISAREAETALWLMRVLSRDGNKQELWNLRKIVTKIFFDVTFSSAPFLIKLKTAGVTVMPHVYFALIARRNRKWD